MQLSFALNAVAPQLIELSKWLALVLLLGLSRFLTDFVIKLRAALRYPLQQIVLLDLTVRFFQSDALLVLVGNFEALMHEHTALILPVRVHLLYHFRVELVAADGEFELLPLLVQQH